MIEASPPYMDVEGSLGFYDPQSNGNFFKEVGYFLIVHVLANFCNCGE